MKLKTMAATLGLLTLMMSSSEASPAIGAFFSSDTDHKLQLYRADDMARMHHFLESEAISGRDPSIRYYNGNFYICLVDAERTFKIFRSSDLIDWTVESFNVIDRDKKYPEIWAPDLFIDDDGSAYVYFSKQKGLNKKFRERTFDIYVSRADSIEQPNFAAATKVELPNCENVIDAHVHKLDGRYYMIVKNEKYVTNNENKSPALFRSDNPIGNFVEIKDWQLRAIRGVEGFSIAEHAGRVYVYGDNYSGKYDAAPTSHYTVWSVDRNDFERGQYSAEYVWSDRPMRHGSVIRFDDHEADQVIARFAEDDAEPEPIEQRILTLTQEDYGSDKSKGIAIENFAPAPMVVYRIEKKARVSIKNLVNAYGVDRIEFILEPGASINIENVLLRENNDSAKKDLVLARDGEAWSIARQ